MPAGDLNERIAACQKRMMAGDHAAISELHRHLSGGLVVHFLRRLGGGRLENHDVADELAHRTWIEFWKALQGGKYDPSKARPSTFLYAISANIWLRYRREQGRERGRVLANSSDRLAEVEAQMAAVPLHLAESLELIRRVVDGDEPHAPFSRDDLQMLRCIVNGHSEREIADSLSLSPSTAHERKRSVLRRFSEFLAGRGFISQKSRAAHPPSSEEREAT